jgi:2-dehydropantoate 2-reductase
MRIAIMGSGGIGGYYGAHLATDPENDVWFIARGPHLEAIRKSGLHLKSSAKDISIHPAQATDNPAEIGPVDMVVFAVKLYSVEAVAELCRPLIGENTGVISLQNGIGSEQQIDKVLGAGHAIGGIVYAPLKIEKPGTIRLEGEMAHLIIGEMSGETTPRIEQFLATCARSGLSVQATETIQKDLWEKFVMISSFAGITGLTRQTVTAMQEDETTFDLFVQALQETLAVAEAEGFALDKVTLVEKFSGIIRNMPPAAESSLLTDLKAGRALENQWFSGMICDLARKHGLATPVHQSIYVALRPFENGSG